MIAKVIVDIQNSNVDKVFDYIVPDDMNVELGHRVSVSFGNRFTEGFVIELTNESNLELAKIKPIHKILDVKPCIIPEMIMILDEIVHKFHLRKIDVIRLFLPTELRGGRVNILTKNYIQLKDRGLALITKNNLRANAKSQSGAIDYFLSNERLLLSDANKKFGVGAISKLRELGVLEIYEEKTNRQPHFKEREDKLVELSKRQQEIVNEIAQSKQQNILLFGVTGSGKTEIYMHAIENMLKQNKTAIMLVPEISLTPQVLMNFKARFGDDVAILHSGLSAGERYDEWRRLLEGNAHIAVGARSAIFAPLKDIGIIVIDEEHDGSYISDSNPRYDTIQIAQIRSKYNNCPLLLGSATPSIESFYKAQTGEYKLLELPARINNKPLPKMKIVDMYGDLIDGNFTTISGFLYKQLKQSIERNEQALVFINRRGFVSFKKCSKCGYTPKCEDCDIDLVYHKEDEQLKCHFCDRRYKALTNCPKCNGKMEREGASGTEKVCEELTKLFPNVKIFRMDNDTTRNKQSHSKILDAFEKTRPSILVGTQMVAKGHDFPLITTVGIINADMALFQSDYRATERCFQLVTQVSGRAGRSDREGEVILQTFKPKNYVYQFAGSYDYKGFYNREIALREASSFPPFATIVRILFTSEKEDLIIKNMKNVWEKVQNKVNEYKDSVIYCKAVACPIKRVKSKYRYQILMRIKNNEDKTEIIKSLYDITDEVNVKQLYIFVEINPSSLS